MSQGIGSPDTHLSVVVASQDSAATIGDCLASLQQQCTDDSVEIIVVDNSTDGSAQIVEREFPAATLIKVPDLCLVPGLWARGASCAAGDVVAFTTGHCVPEANWLAEILRSHESPHAGVGGAIDNRRPSSITQWATYFARFATFMLPFPERLADQIPGDNGSYKRVVLEECADLIKGGFWETDVNRRLREGGRTLLLTPRIVVQYAHRANLWTFCRQRMQHGRVFGATRISGASPLWRLIYLTLTPAVPAVILAKITRRVWQSGGRRRELVLSFPLLVLCVLAWSLGELRGYLSGLARALGPARGATGGCAARDH